MDGWCVHVLHVLYIAGLCATRQGMHGTLHEISARSVRKQTGKEESTEFCILCRHYSV